ncbi:hypothetical protein HGRIS_008303 [Hohenbuehelia grisea]|uniref:Pleiotropic drug resistance ABC transporter n=1 Tax=Hohenbuehelia grisea TaxID=104357 RepID=A0ABR3J7Q6_9AGAR
MYHASASQILVGSVLLNSVAPLFITLLSLLRDGFRATKYRPSILRALCSPFSNFLSIEDLEERKPLQVSHAVWKTRLLVLLSLVHSAYFLSLCIFSASQDGTRGMVEALIGALAWANAFIHLAIRPPVTPPYLPILLGCFHILSAILDVALEQSPTRTTVGLFIFRAAISGAFIWLAGSLPLQAYIPTSKVAKPGDLPSYGLSCPEDYVTLWSWSSFSFVEPIFAVAMRGTLQGTDVWSLSPYFKHKNLFNKCLKYRAANPNHSLLRFLLVSNSLDLILDLSLELWSTIVGFVPAYALKEILAALADNSPASRRVAFYWALVTFIAHLTFAQKDLFKSWHTRRCYERTRGQLFCTLHYKSLKRRDVSNAGMAEENDDPGSADLGRIVNLMQGDSYAVSQRFWEFSGIFMSPIRLGIALVFLYNVLGWSALSGVVVVLVAYVMNYPLARYNISITRASWKAKDRRMDIVNELFQNVRFLKFYGWENQWSRRAQGARETELKWRVKENVIDTFISFIWTWIPSATALVSFMCYTLIAGEKLTISKAFTSIALFSSIQEPMTALPGQFFALLHAYVSMQRIEEFLKEGEVVDWASALTVPDTPSSYDTVGFEDAVCEWYTAHKQATPARFTLGPLSIKFSESQLTLVTGATGSGKSALLKALLGELNLVSGKIQLDKRNHQVAYCAQNPWLEHATIRDNIIFGSQYEFDEDRYQAVIEACALTRDLGIFEAGDLTEIGEKGITLSGGQRARLALARALYSQAKYILLDDPLAAVDMHTAHHLVSNCLRGSLVRDRTIILVTHHVSLCLPIASYLVELEKGAVLRQGLVENLAGSILDQVVAEVEEPFIEESPPKTPENEADENAKKDGRSSQRQPGSGKLIEAEARAEGRVALRTYWTYIKAAGIWCWALTIVVVIFMRFINVGNQVFLAKWGAAYQLDYFSTAKVYTITDIWGDLPSPDVDVKPWLLVYFYISMAGAFAVLAYIALGYYSSLQASRVLFIALLKRLTRAPARFFDTTPIGRILNRFTTDINTVDGALLNSVRGAAYGVLNFLVSFLVIVLLIPTFTPFALIIAWLYIRLAPPYVRASRDLRRLESISLSPAFAGFDELLRGLVHVRAFGMENRYQDGFYAKVDKFQAFDHVYWLVNGWLRWRYDCLGSIVVFATTIFALWAEVSDGSAAIVIVQAGIFADASRQLVKVAAQLELDFNSVERIVEYMDVPQEAPPVIEKSRPPAYWPSSSGNLVVEGLIVKYAPDLPPALCGISFTLHPSEKVGVVGRTGSGKSTLALSFLRMVEPAGGKILIDGIDVSTIGLEDLRTRITIVSQDVSLFTGTIRSNLDPFGEHSDEECWDVLSRCHLPGLIANADDPKERSLDMPISQSGSLSAGERQLIALARAVLRRTNIVIMDEATSQIDSQLDDQIQKTIREELSGALVITIAHRLKTIIDYDRILLLDNGEVLEFGTPKELFSKPGGAFREMCKRSADWPLLQLAVDAQ